MPEFLPFAGLRYAAGGDLTDVVAPPYDVIEPAERDRLAARSPFASVRLILPEGPEPYAAAAADLARWRDTGVLRRDPTPRYYAYRMSYENEGEPRTTLGVLGALALPAVAGEGDVLPHERTLPKAKTDRLALLEATRANLDPIWGLTPAPALGAAIGPALAAPPVATAVADGVHHALYTLDGDDTVAAVRAAVGSVPLVLADGHHRFETAISYRDAARGTNRRPGTDHVMALVVELAPEQLWVQAIHRLHGALDGGARRARARLDPAVEFDPLGALDEPSARARAETLLAAGPTMVWVDRDGFAGLRPRSAPLDALRSELPPPLRDVASAWYDGLVRPALEPPTFRHDADALVEAVRTGVADAAVLLSAVTVDQIRAAAVGGVRMPEKTTFFAPKPRTGMVFRLLDDAS